MTDGSARSGLGPSRPVAAAALILASAVLQIVAAVERWLVAPTTWIRSDRWIEDHLFDYSYPVEPWENVGMAAQWFGAGYLLLAFGVVTLAGRGPSHGFPLARLAAIVSAVSLGFMGVHSLASGLLGAPTFLQGPLALFGTVGSVGLLALATVHVQTARATAFARALLLITTVPEHLFASMVIAPAIVGKQSYDTTAHSETVVAAGTAAAAIVLLVGAARSAHHRRQGGHTPSGRQFLSPPLTDPTRAGCPRTANR